METNRPYLIAADTGGTFTDLAVYDMQTGETTFGKTLTNYQDLVNGVIDALTDAKTELDRGLLFKHGTTQVINAFVQRRGSRAALVSTAGFRDILDIGRGNRPHPFDLDYRRAEPLVPRNRCFEVPERIDAKGQVEIPVDRDAVLAVAAQLREQAVDAVAVSFLNAYLNDRHERQVAAWLAEALPGVYICTGTDLTREWSEYERATTVAANAFVGPKMGQYIRSFHGQLQARGFDGALYMMASNGGVMSVNHTLAQPIALLESGPIGGCIGAAAYAELLNLPRLIAFDMGGTTAKCALVEDGEFEVQNTYYVGGYVEGFPIRTPVLDIVEVGAGGGSIAWIDPNGKLRVGPQSAGSEPGPICFGRGGEQVTVTDANLMLGRIGTDSFVGGKLSLDLDAVRTTVARDLAEPLGFGGEDGSRRVAGGVLELAVVTMTSAIKEITIERGRDVRDFDLFVMGGGGPLFASQLAHELKIRRIIVPPHPGAFSSLGMLMADARMDTAQSTLLELGEHGLAQARDLFATLEADARESLLREHPGREPAFIHELEMRYRGQKHTVRVRQPESGGLDALRAAFEVAYRKRYHRVHPENPVDIVMVRLGTVLPMPKPNLRGLAPAASTSTPSPRLSRAVAFDFSGRLIDDVPVYRRSELPVGFEMKGPVVIEEYSATTLVGPHDTVRVGVLGEMQIVCEGS